VRDRWPRLYAPSLWLARQARLHYGAVSDDGSLSLRQTAFEAARSASRAVIGASAETSLELATSSTLATLTEFAREENLAVVCRLAVPIASQFSRREEHERRVAAFKAAVLEACARWRFAAFDSHCLAAERGRTLRYSPDGLYHNLESRRFEADAVAENLLRELSR
ncbi:MAG TPA: hypothetical protein VH951_10760, partial [Dehalococcoidia bacterium]